jgi:hypothetical protein
MGKLANEIKSIEQYMKAQWRLHNNLLLRLFAFGFYHSGIYSQNRIQDIG